MKAPALLLLLVFSAAPARGGAAGDAMPFLKLDAGARGAALGGAYSAAGGDALSVFYNPAGTALAEKKEILLGHNEWLEDLRNETLAYVHPVNHWLTVFTGFNALLGGSMQGYDADGAPAGSFSPLESALSLGLSVSMGSGWHAGLAGKRLSQDSGRAKDSSPAMDAGLLKIMGAWRAGVAAANLGGELKLGGERFEAPRMTRGGISYSFAENYLAAAEVISAGGSGTAYAAGAEARFRTGPHEVFSARCGYRSGRSGETGPGVTAGVGLSNRELKVDYAFSPYGDLGNSHRVTLSLRFGVKRPAGYKFNRKAYYGLPPARAKTVPAEKKKEKRKKEKKSGKDDVYFMW